MKYPQLSTQEVDARRRIVVVLVEAPIFLGAVPAGIVLGGRALDRLLGLPVMTLGLANVLVGLLLVIPGFIFGIWSVAAQFIHGRGTPAPQMASQVLVTGGPFAYTRNPMALGIFLLLAGVALGFGSIMALIVVVVLIAALLTVIKRGEEAALEARFGDAYRAYRERTPFFFPRLKG